MRKAVSSQRDHAWVLLITNLPGHNPNLRMRVWRALKASGAALLRDGVYLLPETEVSRTLLSEQAEEIKGAGGIAHLLEIRAATDQQEAFTTLFDRTDEYAKLLKLIARFGKDASRLTEPEARQQLAALRRAIEEISKRDFFAGEPRRQAEQALGDAENAVNARFSPDEPHSAQRAIVVRDRKAYRERVWATRENLWIDRVASAWLIQRFIDPKAKFLWLGRPADCPKKALGFDFDGAEFTHTGGRVTFEVLLASFGLEVDGALARLGALVHFLDVGGVPVAEAQGFATIMAGARAIRENDDQLLKIMSPILDSLYAGYANSVVVTPDAAMRTPRHTRSGRDG